MPNSQEVECPELMNIPDLQPYIKEYNEIVKDGQLIQNT
jgi:hypothetical protein